MAVKSRVWRNERQACKRWYRRGVQGVQHQRQVPVPKLGRTLPIAYPGCRQLLEDEGEVANLDIGT